MVIAAVTTVSAETTAVAAVAERISAAATAGAATAVNSPIRRKFVLFLPD